MLPKHTGGGGGGEGTSYKPLQKRAKNLNTQYEEIHRTDKFMSRCSTFLETREIKIKATMNSTSEGSLRTIHLYMPFAFEVKYIQN